MIFACLAGYNRGSYNQSRWGNSYRDGGSDSRGGYNRTQPSGGSYNRPAPYTKGAYSPVTNMTFLCIQCSKKNKLNVIVNECILASPPELQPELQSRVQPGQLQPELLRQLQSVPSIQPELQPDAYHCTDVQPHQQQPAQPAQQPQQQQQSYNQQYQQVGNETNSASHTHGKIKQKGVSEVGSCHWTWICARLGY